MILFQLIHGHNVLPTLLPIIAMDAFMSPIVLLPVRCFYGSIPFWKNTLYIFTTVADETSSQQNPVAVHSPQRISVE